MKILANRKIKALFCKIVACILVFALISVSFIVFGVHDAALYILLCALAMDIVILIACYGYFKNQNRIMEDAVEQITFPATVKRGLPALRKENCTDCFMK